MVAVTSQHTSDTQPIAAGPRSLTVDAADVPVAVRITTDTGAREPRADLRMLTRSGQHQLAVTNDPNGIRLTLGGAPASSLQWTRAGEITLVLPPTSREQ